MSALLPIWLLLAVPGSAGAAPAPSDAAVVQLDVTVRDLGGRPVRDLEQDRFTVTDSGERQAISRFEESLAARVILVVDTSASMDQSFWSARRAAWDLLQRLDPAAEVAVAACAHTVSLASRFSTDQADASAGLASLRLARDEGSTLLACIGESAGLVAGESQAARRAVVLITDGRETSLSGRALESAVGRLRGRLEQTGVELHVLGQGRPSWLIELAGDDGSFRAPWHRKDAVEGLARRLGHHYRVGFQEGNGPQGRRPVQVQVRGTGLIVDAPTGYRSRSGLAPGAPH